jgi:hypothetical protein
MRVQNVIFLCIHLNIQFSRNPRKKTEGDIVLFSEESPNKLKFGLSQNSHGMPSERYVYIIQQQQPNPITGCGGL